VCFFLSGAAGLIYEIAWSKSLGLLFGHTVYANATVLAIFMLGLAGGSVWLGIKSEESQRPIALYGWIELGIAATGAASLPALTGLRWLYYAVHPYIDNSTISLLVVRAGGAVLVLAVPSFLMGGTLPILLRGLVPPGHNSLSQISKQIGRLYWVNTFGAVVGAGAAGFLLLPGVGLRLSVATAALLNLCAGGIALLVAAPRSTNIQLQSKASPRPSENKNHQSGNTTTVWFLLVAFGLVGGTAICYEIASTRLLATTLGSSTYAFTIVLATFLLGIALGSAFYEYWSRRHQSSIKIFAVTQSCISIAALLFLVSLRELPNLLPPIFKMASDSFRGLLVGQFLVAGLALLPAAAVFGFNFPAVIALLTSISNDNRRPGESTGTAYAVNTLGAVLSAVVTGFFLIPSFGSFRVIALAAVANVLVAFALEWFCSPRRPAVLSVNVVLLLCAIIVGWSSLFYDRALASFSTVLYWNLHQVPLTVQEAADTEDIVFLEDGLNATISVSRSDNYVGLRTNGKVDASSADTNTQILLADLGAVFHPNPRRILIIGLGSGMTASAVSRFPEVEQIDCVEIEPAVLHAAPHLTKLSRGVLKDTRLHLILDDARNTLLTSRQQYDLVISEPSNPWIAGVATLFTDEFYAAVTKRLAPGGMFIQWVQGYSLEPSDLRMILATITPRFNDVTLWHSAGFDFLIFARMQKGVLEFSRSRALWSKTQVQEDVSTLRIARPESWPVYFRLNDSEVRYLAAGGDRNTDDRTLLEYRAPKGTVGEDRKSELEALIKNYQRELLPDELLPTEKPLALQAAAESSLDLDLDVSAAYVGALDSENSTPSLEIIRGRLALKQNRSVDAINHFNRALELEPENAKATYWLAIAKHFNPTDTEADLLLDRVLQRDPQNALALASRVAFARDRKDWIVAARAQERLTDAMSDPQAAEFCRLGDLRFRAGNLNTAENALKIGLERDPYSYLCNRELGEIERVKGRLEEASTHLQLVVRMYPEMDPGTYASLALVYEAQKRLDSARTILEKGLRIFPGNPLLSRMSIH